MMARKKIDVRTFPAWLRGLLVTATVVGIVALAWHVGRDEPIPYWIEAYLVPFLGWAYIVLVCIAVGSWLLGKRK